MIFNSNETIYRLCVVLNLFGFASVYIWKIGPTVFTVMSFVVNHKIVAKRWAVIFMHSNWKFCFKRCEFFTFELLWRRDKKTLFFSVFMINPIVGWIPREWTKPNNNIIKLSFSNCDSIGNTIALLMENLSWKIILSSSIQQMYIINLSAHHFLKVFEILSHNAWG